MKTQEILKYFYLCIYRCGQQTLPSDFRAIFEALRLFTTTQIIFYLFPLGLRILKWGETSLYLDLELFLEDKVQYENSRNPDFFLFQTKSQH